MFITKKCENETRFCGDLDRFSRFCSRIGFFGQALYADGLVKKQIHLRVKPNKSCGRDFRSDTK